MRIVHMMLALLLVAIWGFNFVFIQFALEDMSALMLCMMRFLLASLPMLFFIKKPKTSWFLLCSYGLLIFALQFLLLFWGMHLGVTAGLAGLLVQVQVFFSLFFAVVVFKEQVSRWQIMGACISFAGVGVVFMHVGGDVSFPGLLLIMGASLSWGFGSMVIKKIGPVHPMGLVVWGSFIAFVPLCCICLMIEGPAKMMMTLEHISTRGLLSVFYIAYASTWIGYGIWNWLLSSYEIGLVMPFTFLVPIFAMLGSILVFDEAMQFWKISAGILVILGLMINLISARAKRA
jgi:O-acetylserine/cysteine efflux transporter